MIAYYNEIDPYAAQWLRNLIAAGHIAPGIVDERSIVDVDPHELLGFTQCHFFAGIGVWSHALRKAGWSDDRPIWTGSCPCQPFSAAGKQKGFDDERHLWPVWHRLIEMCRPSIVLGEQVASALGWFDLVSTDLEATGYAVGAADLCAAGFEGAHIRQRLYFVGLADPADAGLQGRVYGGPDSGRQNIDGHLGRDGTTSGLADSELPERGPSDFGTTTLDGETSRRVESANWVGKRREFGGLADAPIGSGQPGQSRAEQRAISAGDGGSVPVDRTTYAPTLGRNPVDWLYCRDGKWRPVRPRSFPLAYETPARVGRLRAYGNAIDAETATQFIGAVMDVID